MIRNNFRGFVLGLVDLFALGRKLGRGAREETGEIDIDVQGAPRKLQGVERRHMSPVCTLLPVRNDDV